MKFRQHIRVYGYPEALKVKIPIKHPGKLNLSGVGEINLMSIDKVTKFKKLMDQYGIKYRESPASEVTRIRYLCMKGSGVGKSIRGRKYKGDILYTVEADDERELLDKRDAALSELKTLKVKYEDVCKWVCETAPKMKTARVFKQKRERKTDIDDLAEDTRKLKNTVADVQEKLLDYDKASLRRSAIADKQARDGVLH